jgi:tartronate-semialdehyde synthase
MISRSEIIGPECEMAKMRAIDAAVRILEREGVVCAFGVPGAAINPL